jgi:hypothetical protein
MADLKISALTASTTPLAGTEVLPIVQSSTTKQVSVANLTAGRAVSALSLATSAGYTFRAADNTNYELLRYVGGSNNPGIFVKVDETTNTANLWLSGSVTTAQVLGIGAAGVTDVLKIGSANVTVNAGNLAIGTTGKGIALSDFGGVRSFGWGNVSSISQDLSTLFDNVSFTNRGLSIQVQVITQSSSSAATSATFVGLRTPGGTWAFTLVNAASAGVNTITPSGSGTTLTLTFSVGNQFGVALVTLISQS